MIIISEEDISVAKEKYVCCVANAVGRIDPVEEPEITKFFNIFPNASGNNEQIVPSAFGSYKIIKSNTDQSVIIFYARLYPGLRIMSNDNPSIRKNKFIEILDSLLQKPVLTSLAFMASQLTPEYIQLLEDFNKKYLLRHTDADLNIKIYGSAKPCEEYLNLSNIFPEDEPPTLYEIDFIKIIEPEINELGIDKPTTNESATQCLATLFPAEKCWAWLFSDQKFQELLLHVDQELGQTLYQDDTFPQPNEIFNAFKLCQNPKVVILGQDPYPTRGNAHGLAFSVKKGVKIPVSLNQIFTSMKDIDGFKKPKHGCLESWAKQGVLLLNSGLTVKEGCAGSHVSRWETLTDYIIKRISEHYKKLIFILWGVKAQEKKRLIAKSHLILEHSHPAARTGSFGKECKNMEKVNPFLIKEGLEPIDWNL